MEDIYMYGAIKYEKPPDWQFKSRDLAIGNIIKVGRFARIYKATLYKKGKSQTVIAKTLKGTTSVYWDIRIYESKMALLMLYTFCNPI